MFRFVRRLIKVVFLIALLFVGVSYLLPKEVVVTRMTTIEAAPEEIFPHLNSLQKFAEWSPWTKIDPEMKVNYSGPETGVGNKMAWVSEMREVGTGSQEIVDSVVNERVSTAPCGE